jgi:hypothetical protein
MARVTLDQQPGFLIFQQIVIYSILVEVIFPGRIIVHHRAVYSFFWFDKMQLSLGYFVVSMVT